MAYDLIFYMFAVKNYLVYFKAYNDGCFPTKDLQSRPLRSGHICMKDAHSTESNEKSSIRFFRSSPIQKKSRWKVVKFTENMRNELKRMKKKFSDFYIFSYGRLYLQSTVTHQVCHRPKKKVLKLPNLQERCALIRFFSSCVFFFCVNFTTLKNFVNTISHCKKKL